MLQAEPQSKSKQTGVRCGRSSMVEQKPSKLMMGVRFPSPAPEGVGDSGLRMVGELASRSVFDEPVRPGNAESVCRRGGFEESSEEGIEQERGMLWRKRSLRVPSRIAT